MEGIETAINFLHDAIEYLKGRDGGAPDVEAALDAMSEASSILARTDGRGNLR